MIVLMVQMTGDSRLMTNGDLNPHITQNARLSWSCPRIVNVIPLGRKYLRIAASKRLISISH